jgi:uncharacterized Ntn-hydrolase superfamily protein
MASMRFLGQFVLALLLLAVPARATWSILIIDLATGEVAVGIATCLTGFDLRPTTIVVVPGYGVAAAQSFVGPLNLRELIRQELFNRTPPAQILAMLAAADPGHQTRQYGIADTLGGTVTFSGTGAGAFAGGLTGSTGTLVYTVQGNVITGLPVLQAAETAIQNTAGTVGDKLMAAMQAARAMGGDGRCSCLTGGPTSCGSPPASFVKSAHIGLMIVSRPGDLDAPCSGGLGCAAGQYYLDLNVANQPASAVDPVLQLQALYNAWRAQQAGRPDHFQSSVSLSSTSIRANGVDTVTGTVTLRDAQGNPLGTTIPVTVGLGQRSTAANVTFSPAVPQPNGTYTFTMTGELGPGQAIVDVVANDGLGPVHISPQPVVDIGDPFGPCASGAVANGAGGTLDALRIDGSAGGTARITEVGFAQPFALTIDPPVGAQPGSRVGAFALWAHLGLPRVNGELPLGAGNGALCFTPFPLDPTTPSLLVADSVGLGAFIPAGPAPWTLPFPGVPALLDVALQAAMFADPTDRIVATNAVLMRVRSLPQPTIGTVTPAMATAGTLMTVTGTSFFNGVELRVSGAVTPILSRTSSILTFTMPAGVGCDSTVSVTNPGGAPVAAGVNLGPVVLTTPFPSGPAAGGALFAVTGRNLLGCTLTINGAPLNVTSQNGGVIFGTTPPGTPGPAVVEVRHPLLGCFTQVPYTYL